MNQIPSGVCLRSRKPLSPDVEPVHESYEDYNSGSNEDPHKAIKKIGTKAPIPEQYLPFLSDFMLSINAFS